MVQTPDAPGGGIRARLRSQVRHEAKQVALRQLAEGGPGGLSINAIGKELGVSGPALYRYFASRDDLLNELVVDAYHDLAVALEEATARRPRQRPQARLRALAVAYRAWANAQPHRYRLLYTAPVPGYDAQSAQLVAASKGPMDVLINVLSDLTPDSGHRKGASDPLSGQLERWSQSRELGDISPAVALRAIIAWSRMHGLVSLEIEGNFASMAIDPELLFEAEIAALR
jgi:AcrR family transcriptional regulator